MASWTPLTGRIAGDSSQRRVGHGRTRIARVLAITLIMVTTAACGGPDDDTAPTTGSVVDTPAPEAPSTSPADGPPSADPSIETAVAPASTAAAELAPASTTSSTTTVTAAPTTAAVIATSTTTPLEPGRLADGVTRYAVPSPDPGSSWGRTHSGYAATDIFVPSGCGGDVVSPADGVLLEVRRVDGWDPAVDNPATRGGRSVAVLGDDGVRYYLAHFADIEPVLAPGVRVAAGERLGSVGTTGRSSACHIHFGISPPCPDREWSVRRGAIWPYPYLDAWRQGEQLSPVDEVRAWVAEHPDACALAALDPQAGDA